MALTYEGIVGAILDYYEPGSPIFERIVTGVATPAEVYNAYSYIPQMQVVQSINGSVMGIDYAEPLIGKLTVAEDIASGFDSNFGAGGYSGGGSFTGNVPSFVTVDQSGNAIATTGVKTVGGTTLASIADKLSLGVVGISLGAKLGKMIDEGIYSLAPDWWNEHFPTINPETWVDIAGENELGQYFIRALFGIDDLGVTTPYLDERLLAYYYQMMRDNGMWSTGGSTASIRDTTGLPQDVINSMPFAFGTEAIFTGTYNSGTNQTVGNALEIVSATSDVKVFCLAESDSWAIYACSKESFRGKSNRWNQYGQYSRDLQVYSTTINNKLVYYANVQNVNSSADYVLIAPPAITGPLSYHSAEVAYVILYGDITTTPTLPGTSDMTGATQYPPTNITGTTTDQVLQQLKQQYPQLFQGSVTSSVLQPDGTTKTITYVPVPYPTDTPTDATQPVTPEDTTQDPTVDPDSQTLPIIIGGTDTGDDTTPPTEPPSTGTGDGPTPVLPTGQASSLWAVYNPTQAQLNAFGSWLWSSDFVEQLKRLFNDPMQAIIGVHKVFATPPTSGSQTIKCGYLDSGVSSAVVSSQYTEVNCGTVKLSEYFGNVFDYAPHTRVSAYLPFIGVVPLDIADIMRSSINISYGVDVITGACLAKIKVTRDSAGGILYSFGGSCAVHYPVSSGSYSGIISAGLTAATGILGTALTGNPMSAVAGVAGAIRSAHTDVQKGGGFTGASGACGPKKPYLIISRPQTQMADDFPGIDGYPANHTTTLGQCSGYVRCKEVHLNVGHAYGTETSEIESLLRSGILI